MHPRLGSRPTLRRLAGSCFLLTLAAMATSQQGQAVEFKLKKGQDLEICRDMAANLKAFPDLSPFPLDMPFDPSLSEFRWVDWEALDPLSHESILRQYIVQREAFREGYRGKEKTPGEQQVDWRAWRPVILREARAGKVYVERATFDSNRDGKHEPVYRVALKDLDLQPAIYDPRGWTPNWAYVVLPDDDRKASRQWIAMRRSGADPFYYKEQLFYYSARGPDVIEPHDRGGHIEFRPLCEFGFKPLPVEAAEMYVEEPIKKAALREIGFVQSILRRGGDPNTLDITGATLLEIATWRDYRDEVKALLERGADPNLCGLSSYNCPLRLATDSETEILRLLVAAGADVNWTSEQNETSVLTGVAGQAWGRFFIGKSAVEFSGRVGPLPDPVESARILIDAGADVNHVDSLGDSPLRSAMRGRNLEVAKLLLDSGADISQRRDDSTSWGEWVGNTILMEIIGRYEFNKNTEAIELLLDHGANPNDANERPYDAACPAATEGRCQWRGHTALTFAASRGWSEVVRLLLRHGADPTIPRRDGKTALDLAQEQGHAKTAALLRARDGDR